MARTRTEIRKLSSGWQWQVFELYTNRRLAHGEALHQKRDAVKFCTAFKKRAKAREL